MAKSGMNNIKIYIRIILLLVVILPLIALNYYMYITFTKRLGNNFGNASSVKMIDVSQYLPFEDNSMLVELDSSLKLNDNLPVLDGAAALVPVYASIIDNVYPEDSVTYEGGVFSDDNYYGENFASDSVMQYKNTVRGFEAVVNGETDIFFSAMPSDKQKQYASDNGVELEIIPIGREAFIFFVNSNNPIDNLSVDQIRSIYSGEIKNWKYLGGINRVINPVTRYPGSGSQTMMDKFMGEIEYGKKSLLAMTGASIGYSFRYYFESMVDNEQVKMISVNGIYPSAENIRNATYPIATDFYVIYRKDNDNPNVKCLVEWILSEEGQYLIDQSGYISIKK